MKVVLLSFCNKDWQKRHAPLRRLRKEAMRMGLFDEIMLYDEETFDSDYKAKFVERFKERSFGYWQWKSYLIKRELERLDDGDILFYCDSGCHLNSRGKLRFEEYVETVRISKSGVIAIDNGLDERCWTKGDMFDFFGIKMSDYEGTQYLSGVLLFRNQETTRQLINDWYDVCHNHHELITDSPSVSPNYVSFVENRHDQSALSLLLHTKYRADSISEDEVWPCWNHDWSLLWDKPIWTCRNHVREAKKNAFVNRMKRKIKKVIKCR